jgi:hypothetical protein
LHLLSTLGHEIVVPGYSVGPSEAGHVSPSKPDQDRRGQKGVEAGCDGMEVWMVGGSLWREQKEGVMSGDAFGLLHAHGHPEEKTVAPGTKPQPRWCPVRLTKTQRRWYRS